jgi:hypothetical protein
MHTQTPIKGNAKMAKLIKADPGFAVVLAFKDHDERVFKERLRDPIIAWDLGRDRTPLPIDKDEYWSAASPITVSGTESYWGSEQDQDRAKMGILCPDGKVRLDGCQCFESIDAWLAAISKEETTDE